jgi:hypothetical protein
MVFVVVVASTDKESGGAGGNSPQLRGRDIASELVDALLANEQFQDLLARVGHEPDTPMRTIVRCHPEHGKSNRERTRRAMRLHVVSLAIRGVLTNSELDYYASIVM